MATDALPIRPGDVHTREEIQPVLGGSLYGGIVPSDEKANVLLFSYARGGARFGYHDGWLREEDELGPVFEYTGAGSGDQVFGGRYGKGNSAILGHADRGRTLHLFIAVGTVPGGRTKRHRYVGAFTLDVAEPYVVRRAPNALGVPRKALIFRLRPIGPFELLADDRIPPAQNTERELVPADVTTSKMVEPEQNKSQQGERAAVAATATRRREAELSEVFEAHLTARGHAVGRFQIRLKGKTSTLLTDLYDATDHVLYEVKGSARRESVRMALGQLLDYGRYVRTDAEPDVPPALVVLLPGLPDADLVELLADHGVGLIHRVGETDEFVTAT
ncbi:hypothetical protein H8N01_09650 [Streptomyces sp. AC536]|uniref:hypothetical protein n=1 Tax=Streptomyces buecherae TaxID=2763006 RepID=UPI00164DA034|nr:hypothetical protein [Streptomyces buecherae]MBC3982825.1 hypothetical protein [Streptomyces buecherae]QNJ40509.1 hypothetical protein H7H31_12115 [Streptomyces buecherae]